jgi:hypothetical protein
MSHSGAFVMVQASDSEACAVLRVHMDSDYELPVGRSLKRKSCSAMEMANGVLVSSCLQF